MTPPKLYLDEDVDPLLAKVLRDRGYDVIAIHEIGQKSLRDREQLEFAINHGRAFLTHNVKHFVQLAQEYVTFQRPHFGIIVSNHLVFKELLRRTLRLLHQQSAENLRNQLIWLHNYK
ncbi:MAG TPA: hypothetical protein ENN18_05230 [Proteobacteria bacterium]|nr:hypothetical protein [Pseudomonadota bacterium]